MLLQQRATQLSSVRGAGLRRPAVVAPLTTATAALQRRSSGVAAAPAAAAASGASAMQRRSSVVASAAAAAGAGGAGDDVKGAMLAPSVANTTAARLLGVAAGVGAMAAGSAFAPAQLLAFLHLTAWGVALGATIFQTFFVGLIMFKAVPRQTFGRIQARLFPAYFALTTGCLAVLLATLAIATPGGLAAAATGSVAALGVALASSLVNMVVLEPRTTDVMFARYELENKPGKTAADDDAIKKLYKKFGALHGISSLLNLVHLIGIVSYAYMLAGRLGAL